MKIPLVPILAGIVAFVVIVWLAFATSGGSFTEDANRACTGHGGIKEMDAHQGYVICRDGVAK